MCKIKFIFECFLCSFFKKNNYEKILNYSFKKNNDNDNDSDSDDEYKNIKKNKYDTYDDIYKININDDDKDDNDNDKDDDKVNKDNIKNKYSISDSLYKNTYLSFDFPINTSTNTSNDMPTNTPANTPINTPTNTSSSEDNDICFNYNNMANIGNLMMNKKK